MGIALREGGLYKVGGKFVDAEGKEIAEKDLPARFRKAVSAPALETDLPEDFPGRKELIAGGLVELETVKTKTRDELIALKGIGEKTADEILEAVK